MLSVARLNKLLEEQDINPEIAFLFMERRGEVLELSFDDFGVFTDGVGTGSAVSVHLRFEDLDD